MSDQLIGRLEEAAELGACMASGTGGTHSEAWHEGGSCAWCGFSHPLHYADEAGREASRLGPSQERDRLLRRRARAIEAAAALGVDRA